MIARFTVIGLPRPQGSKSARMTGTWITLPDGRRALVNPRAYVVEGRYHKRKGGGSSDGHATHEEWRRAVRSAALQWQRDSGTVAISGPATLAVTFYLPRPASLPKRVLYPAKKPDLSKLVRAIEDSLSGIVLVDDALIVSTSSHKRFAADGIARAVISVEALPAFADRQQLALAVAAS